MLNALCFVLLFGLVAAKPMTFKVENCGSPNDPSKLWYLSLRPDPIVIGENITIGFAGFLSQPINLTEDILVTVAAEKKFYGVWMSLPCLDSLGTCNYTDMCGAWRELVNNANLCPIFKRYNIPCFCPLAAGNYTVLPPETTILPNLVLPPIMYGEIRSSISAYTPAGLRLFCYRITVTIAGAEAEETLW